MISNNKMAFIKARTAEERRSQNIKKRQNHLQDNCDTLLLSFKFKIRNNRSNITQNMRNENLKNAKVKTR